MAIFWAIIPVVVFAINLHAVGSWAHVGVEVSKRVFPPVADSDASSAPILKISGAWGVAPAFHCGPNVVFGSGREPVSGICLLSSIEFEAPAALRVARQDFRGDNHAFVPALAAALPRSTTVCRVCPLDRCEPVKLLALEVFHGAIANAPVSYVN